MITHNQSATFMISQTTSIKKQTNKTFVSNASLTTTLSSFIYIAVQSIRAKFTTNTANNVTSVIQKITGIKSGPLE